MQKVARNGCFAFFRKEAEQLERIEKFKFWQDGSHPEEIARKEFFYEKLNYIHKNPVKDMIVEKDEDYLFSSARNYADLSSVLDIVLETPQLISHK